MNFGNRRRFLERFAGSIVIFCAALSEYDQPSLEDGNQVRDPIYSILI